jgi:hypothetical protein
LKSNAPAWLRSELGLSKTLQRIKFGGVVGKQTLLAVIAAVALAAIGLRADPADIVNSRRKASRYELIVCRLACF